MVGYRLFDYDEVMAELSRRARRIGIALAVGVAAGLGSRESSAQLHWDASAQVGVMKRFLAARPSGSSDVGLGPTGQLTGHVALIPLVHVGGYFGYDRSPFSGEGSARSVTFGGVRAKGMLPWVRGAVRAWIFAGFGYAGVYSQSSWTTLSVPTGEGGVERRRGRVEGAGGSFFDVPFGLGVSYKVRRPWEVCAELAARVGFGHTGSVYEEPGPQVTVPDYLGQNATPAGIDRFALGLTVGVMLDL